MTAVIGFLAGALFGGTVGFLVAGILATNAIDEMTSRNTVYIPHGIDPDALIAWIENHNDNYEYMSPPTSGEIIRKIREMGGTE